VQSGGRKREEPGAAPRAIRSFVDFSSAAQRSVQALPGDGSRPFADRLRRVLAERPRVSNEASGATPAAVLIGLFEGREGEPRLWLLRRPSGLRTHSGQVALPGGKRDPTDPDLVSTALREAEEEIGLMRHQVEVLGVADDRVTSTGFVVTPVVGWIRGPFEPQPNPSEVSRTFSAPFATFREDGILSALPFETLRGLVRIFRIEGEIVWGLTAGILTALARRAPFDPP
jgi:8-oxo-dGTP pyrophosphatase MutT (NUDIX family)